MRPASPATAADLGPADPPLADPHARAHALVERQLQTLERLAEIGMDIAEAARTLALAAVAAEPAAPDTPAAPRIDPGLTYSRVARAVRLTLMLQTRLLKELPTLGQAETSAKAAQVHERRRLAHRLVARSIRDEHDDADEVEHLSDEAWERLRDEDLSDDICGRPIGEVVARICRDLGLAPDWSAWAVAGAAGDEAEPPDDAPPPSPLPTLAALARGVPGARPTPTPPRDRPPRRVHPVHPPAAAGWASAQE